MGGVLEQPTLRFEDNAGLCAPADEAFRAWLESLPFGYTGPVCGTAVVAVPAAGLVLLALVLAGFGAHWRRRAAWPDGGLLCRQADEEERDEETVFDCDDGLRLDDDFDGAGAGAFQVADGADERRHGTSAQRRRERPATGLRGRRAASRRSGSPMNRSW